MPRRRPGTRPSELGRLYPTLDLHGETADDARHRTERWLHARAADGVRTVVVITGRGRRSPGPPVLPGEVQDLLATLRGSVVASWEPEQGGGAFRVELQPKRPPRRPPVEPSVPKDAELRRRAEQSLAELGVQPTPLLLAAEMRRLAGGD